MVDARVLRADEGMDESEPEDADVIRMGEADEGDSALEVSDDDDRDFIDDECEQGAVHALGS